MVKIKRYFLKVTTTFVCVEPEDGLAPDRDHRSISLLFCSQTPNQHQGPGYSGFLADIRHGVKYIEMYLNTNTFEGFKYKYF